MPHLLTLSHVRDEITKISTCNLVNTMMKAYLDHSSLYFIIYKVYENEINKINAIPSEMGVVVR